MRNARALTSADLDAIEKMVPGSGALSIFGVTRGNVDSGIVGGGIDYQHRINKSMSAFASGLVGHGWGMYSPLTWEAKAGFRWRF